jgi:hypothetical protein
MSRSPGRFVIPTLLFTSPLWAAVGTITSTPSTVVFNSTPTSGTVFSSVTLTWQMSGGATDKTWNITVQADQSTLANCPSISTSTISVNCTSATVTNSGSGTCSGSFPLSSSSATQVASGQQGSGSSNYTVQITYQFGSDSWSYQAKTCSLNLTYVVDVWAALNDTTPVTGTASSPTATYNSVNKTVSLVFPNGVVWGTTLVWGTNIVWGTGVVSGTSLVWGTGIVWGTTGDPSATSLVWGTNLVWAGGRSPGHRHQRRELT